MSYRKHMSDLVVELYNQAAETDDLTFEFMQVQMLGFIAVELAGLNDKMEAIHNNLEEIRYKP